MEENHSSTYFNPPLWTQRRVHIRELLVKTGKKDGSWPDFAFPYGSLLDIGCGEGKLLEFFANDCAVTKLGGIDLLRSRLDLAAVNLQPKPFELDFSRREAPLDIKIWNGDLTEQSLLDETREGQESDFFQCGVCSEVVEHIPPAQVDSFAVTLFGSIALPVIILTTPNAEYNVNFPDLHYGTPNAIFRDSDHRFEWTRSEFEAWCRSKAALFGYRVSFSGVGIIEGQTYDDSIGYCTQSATFIKVEPGSDCGSIMVDPRTLVGHIQFPTDDISPASREELRRIVLKSVVPYIVKCRASKLHINDDNTVKGELTLLWDDYQLRKLAFGQWTRVAEAIPEILDGNFFCIRKSELPQTVENGINADSSEDDANFEYQASDSDEPPRSDIVDESSWVAVSKPNVRSYQWSR